MDQVQFEDDKFTFSLGKHQNLTLSAKLFIRMGIIRNPENAQFVLIGISCFCFTVATFNFVHFVFKLV